MIQFSDPDIYNEALSTSLFFEEDFDIEGVTALIGGFVALSSLPPGRTRNPTPAARLAHTQEVRAATIEKLPPEWTEADIPDDQLVEPQPEWHVVGWSRETVEDAWAMAGGVLSYNPHGEVRMVLATEALIQACEAVCPGLGSQYLYPDYDAQLSTVNEDGFKFILNYVGGEFICGLGSEDLEPDTDKP